MNELIEGHTVKRYDGELSHLHYLVLEMGGLVIQQIRDALTAFKEGDVNLARKVANRDVEVDRLEVQADEETVRVIARRCPMGSDLRVVITVSKSVSDLERIGDEAVRIASLVTQMFGGHYNGEASNHLAQLVRDVDRIGGMALSSIQYAVELFDVWDEDKALKVITSHREMDGEFQSELRRVMTYIMEDSRNIGYAVSMVLLAKSLDRITHHARNLAEYAIFEIKGVDIRENHD